MRCIWAIWASSDALDLITNERIHPFFRRVKLQYSLFVCIVCWRLPLHFLGLVVLAVVDRGIEETRF